MFSALFGHFPNLVTVRGDRLRNALAFVDSVQRVIDLEPEVLLLGHHGPVRGASTIRARVRADPRRGAVRPRRHGRRHERRARRVDRDADHPRCPTRSGSARPTAGSTGASGRSGRRTRGWIHQHSTLELYGASPEQGSERDRRARRAGPTRSRTGRRVWSRAIRSRRFVCASSRSPSTRASRRARRVPRAHEQLLVEHGRANFWLTRWLEGEVRSATNRLERLTRPTDVTDADPHRRSRAIRSSTPGAARRARLRGHARHSAGRRRDAGRGRVRRAGCDDFGAPDFRARLDATIAAVDADANLGPIGRMVDPAAHDPPAHRASARGGSRAAPARDPRHRAPGAHHRDRAPPIGHDASRQSHRGRPPAPLASLLGEPRAVPAAGRRHRSRRHRPALHALSGRLRDAAADGAAAAGDAPPVPDRHRGGDRAPRPRLLVLHARVLRAGPALARPLLRARPARALRVPEEGAAGAHVPAGPEPVGAEVAAAPRTDPRVARDVSRRDVRDHASRSGVGDPVGDHDARVRRPHAPARRSNPKRSPSTGSIASTGCCGRACATATCCPPTAASTCCSTSSWPTTWRWSSGSTSATAAR